MSNLPEENAQQYRQEHDLIGGELVPACAYYGIQTQRAMRNFNITGVPIHHYPELIISLSMVKKAAAIANRKLGLLDCDKADAIERACDDIIEGKLHDQFKVDLIQGGAGTSTNMNANEVIANLALEHMGHSKGSYQYLHPNNHVNMSQSTNDAYPTAVRLAIIFAADTLIKNIINLRAGLLCKAEEFSSVIKIGRTQLQDAVPMSLGKEFEAYATTLQEEIDRIREGCNLLSEINLGGTAIGTGINAHPDYSETVVKSLSDLSNLRLKSSLCLVEATSDMGAFVLISSLLKRLSIKLSKICNDLRLLSSGPRAGFNEINLPPVQPGSSIMPGKVNPVIPEAVNQVAFQVIGNDMAVTMAAEGGQLQLNAFEPLIAKNILESIGMLCNSMSMLREKCIDGISADVDRCNSLVQSSLGVITVLNPIIGYENASRIAKLALSTGANVTELVLSEGLMDEKTLSELMSLDVMASPH